MYVCGLISQRKTSLYLLIFFPTVNVLCHLLRGRDHDKCYLLRFLSSRALSSFRFHLKAFKDLLLNVFCVSQRHIQMRNLLFQRQVLHQMAGITFEFRRVDSWQTLSLYELCQQLPPTTRMQLFPPTLMRTGYLECSLQPK